MSAAMGDVLRRVLRAVEGGRVLDIATGEGGFVRLLARHMASYTAIVGVDTDAKQLVAARRAHGEGALLFLQCDAGRLGLAAESVDTISLSASLHHLPDLPALAREVRRVLRPGGHLVLAEMHRDAQTEAQRTLVGLHHWVGRVDTALGITHNPTLPREGLLAFVRAVGLRHAVVADVVDVESDPLDSATRRRTEDVIDQTLARARGLPEVDALREQGEALRRRVREVGLQREPVLVVLGRK